MGEIIHHNFGGPEQQPNQPKPTHNMETVMSLTGLLGGGKFGEKMEKFTNTMRKLQSMRQYLGSLQAPHSNETMALRQNLIEGMSFDQMCDAILDSNESMWNQNPTYYKAISDWFNPDNLTKVISESLTGLSPGQE